MELVRKQRVDVVLVWRFDRFARSLTHLVNALEEFNKRSVGFVSYQEGVDTSTAQGKMVFGIMASLAEFERALIIERINAGLRRARSKGQRFGRPGIPESKVAEILTLRGTASVRAIAARTGICKSVVQKVLSVKPIQNVASAIDETPVAF
jgi:DNA invertase Pin-like site-specific DNA recombinase